MPPAIPAMSRRTFLSVSTVATVATAVPAAAAVIGTAGPLAIASRRNAVPADWTGPVVVLSGDYSQRLAQMREAVGGAVGREIALYLDGADAVLFDIANMDQRARLRPVLAPNPPKATRPATGVAA